MPNGFVAVNGATVTGAVGTSGTYVLFGDCPQTIKAASVTVDETDSVVVGAFIYYKGSDGAWYAYQQEKAYATGLTYSDGTAVAQSSANSYKYFKVEPIKWRVVTTSYDHDGDSTTTGKKLLLAESALINGIYYDNTINRMINGNNVTPNNYEHSRVRAYLNGLDYNKQGSNNNEFNGKGFLQTAFTSTLQSSIVTTSVVNNAASTNPDGNPTLWNSGTNNYASNTPTSDKIFLLSEKGVTTSAYGYVSYSSDGVGNARIRKPTDFAMSTGIWTYQFDNVNYGSYWWLRSPNCYSSYSERYVGNDGSASNCSYPEYVDCGVVPALCVTE